ncbi:MAG: hypothetical protein JRI99_09115 [Deltaproteobacteria bacterium]|nr:hypothetical protein [Deltaproteobacteria bacterium]MBW2538027.1 hypothetical protein [Deltaproteobacteria bacterium]
MCRITFGTLGDYWKDFTGCWRVEETGLYKKHYSVTSSLRYSSELAIIAEGKITADMIALIDIEWGADKRRRKF